ncbi:MAG: carbohydrate ABC transporter permease [Acholeplasmatales bacterium]|nr:carbohydrate ABC transporter permease [Acholeplasmatales bacterium]
MNINDEIKKSKASNIIKYIIAYLFLVLWGVIVIFPFYYMIITSFKSLGDYSSETVPQLYSSSGIDTIYHNYKDALLGYNLLRDLGNTLIVSITVTLLTVVVTILAAFAFARLNFKGKNIVFTLFIALMMIPNELVIITNYTTFANPSYDLRNTFFALIMPSIMSVFYVYLLRQNFMQVPDSIYWAAKVDGTSDFKYLMKILVPLSKPTIITIIILKLIECWNAYAWPRLISTSEKYFLVSNAIEVIRSSGGGRDNIPTMMAAVVIVSLPLIILFIIFRKEIMSGVSKTGTKG